MNVATNLIGRHGVAFVWVGIETPCEIVAAYSRDNRLRVVAMATETRAGYHVKGELYDIEAHRNIILNTAP